jgi:antitoxin (DNA-binding transcriptional repressor) of toxin-antitoxin stability system
MNISIREFQLHASRYLAKLPSEEIILTAYNRPIAKVVPFTIPTETTVNTSDKSADTTVTTSDNTKEKPWVPVEGTRCDIPFCKQSSIGTFKISTYNTDTGDEEKTLHLCAWHKGKATKEGAVTKI